MSRTYRRLDVVKRIANRLDVYGTWEPHDMRSWYFRNNDLGQRKYPGKEAEQKLAQIMGDHGFRWNKAMHSKWFINNVQRTHRSQARQELANYRKNAEYEVMIPRKNLLPWD